MDTNKSSSGGTSTSRFPVRKQYRAKYRRWKARYDVVAKQRVELLSDLKKIADKVKQLKEENNHILDLMIEQDIVVDSIEDSDVDTLQNGHTAIKDDSSSSD